MTKSKSAVVVGGGPAGAMAALQLARAGLSVHIISRQCQTRPRVAETLSPEGRSILARAGLWERVPCSVAVPCPAIISTWDQPEPRCRSLITNPYGRAWHIDRRLFDNWLLLEAEGAGAILVTAIVSGVWRIGTQWMVSTHGPGGEVRVWKTDFLVVATGQYSSAVRLGARERIDALCFMGGPCEPTADAGDALVVEAVSNGWWYSAPMTDGRMFAGWMTDAKIIVGKRWREAIDGALTDAPLTRSRIVNVSNPDCVGVVSSAMTPCAGEGWVAVGDAALARDPLSGEGLAYALQSGWQGAKTIFSALEDDDSAWETASERGALAIAQYRNQKILAYSSAQRRWPDEPFWVRRVH